MKGQPFVLWFEEVKPDAIDMVGGKGLNLGILYQKFSMHGVRVPPGLVITTDAWREFIAANPLLPGLITWYLKRIDYQDQRSLQMYSSYAWRAISEARMPANVAEVIERSYGKLEKKFWENLDVAVRSSAVSEDLRGASFAGQHDSYLNVRGGPSVVEAVQRCFASIFTERAVSYRHERGFAPFPQEGIAVVIQKMVRSDLASSGVAFSNEPVSNADYLMRIEASWGLGELVVRGLVTPDTFLVAKPFGAQDKPILIGRELGTKDEKLVYAYRKPESTEKILTSQEEREAFSLTKAEAEELGAIAHILQQLYGYAMDLEWAKDGSGLEERAQDGDGRIYVVQARPATFTRDPHRMELVHVSGEGDVLLEGLAASPGAGSGPVNVIESAYHLEQFRAGDVLVTDMTDPDWVPIMRRAAAIITNRGGTNCHAAIVARELGVPCIVGTGNATLALKHIPEVTVDVSRGERGVVFAGLLPLEKTSVDLQTVAKKKAWISTPYLMLILADPFTAQKYSFYPNDGIGLARLEFIIANQIQVHPNTVLLEDSSQILNAEECVRLEMLTRGYPDSRTYFVQKLADGISQLALAVWPNPIIVRLSDFKSNEYARLLGGIHFEPREENPMIGWRGASRYYDARYLRAFRELECEAIRIVRAERKISNVKVMIPFCRTLEEAKKVTGILREEGFARGQDGFELYMMVEIPSNVVLLEKFAEYFDGFSIGSNDLTQLTLGLDRDSGELAHVGNERDPAVRALIAMAIKKARKAGKPIGICGQAPSKFPEYAKWLVKLGITSISVNPDAIPQTVELILSAQNK